MGETAYKLKDPEMLSVSSELDMDRLTEKELCSRLQRGLNDIEEGRTQNAAEAFDEFRRKNFSGEKL